MFAGRRGLDQVQLRQAVARIPEVSQKLKLAQLLIDKVQGHRGHLDLFSILHASDGEFSSNQNLRALLAAIVQLGLYDRYVRFYGQPTFLVGSVNGVSALTTTAGVESFEEMILTSKFYEQMAARQDEPEPMTMGHSLTLSGLSLEEFAVFAADQNQFVKQDWGTQDCYQLLSQLYQDYQVEQFVHVGPNHEFRDQEMAKRKIFEFSLGNSIELDPILNSFWKTAVIA